MNLRKIIGWFKCIQYYIPIIILLFTFNGLNASGNYSMKVTIDTKNYLLSGSGEILFINDSPFPINKLIVRYSGKAIKDFDPISFEDKSGNPVKLIPADGYDLNNSKRLLIKLEKDINPNDSLNLKFIFNQAWLNTTNTEWALDKYWYPHIDPGYLTAYSFNVKFAAPAGMLYPCTGAFISRNKFKGSKDLEVIEFQSNPIAHFQLGALPKDTWNELVKTVNDVQVRVFWNDDYWGKWMPVFADIACDVIRYYEKEFKFYPGKHLCIVPGEMKFTGGAPVAPGIVAIHNVENSDNAEQFSKWIIAHEIGHQYFGEYVLDNGLSWLSLGLGLYVDRHYAEFKHLQNYSSLHNFAGYINAAQKGTDTKLGIENSINHSKGYAVIRMLEELTGEDNFKQLVSEFLSTYAYKEINVDNFRKICERYIHQDLRWYFSDWIETSKTLSYNIIDTVSYSDSNRYILTITLSRSGEIQMPIPVKVKFSDGQEQVKWTDKDLDFPELTFISSSPYQEILINPDNMLPMIMKETRKKPVNIEALTKNDIKNINKELIKNIYKAMGNYTPEDCKKVASYFKDAQNNNITDARAWHLLGIALYDGRDYENAMIAFKNLSKYSEEYRGVVFVWLGHINDLLGNRAEAVKYYNNALGEKIISQQYGQYGIQMSSLYVRQFLDKPFERKGR